eukprot:sb/3471752/
MGWKDALRNLIKPEYTEDIKRVQVRVQTFRCISVWPAAHSSPRPVSRTGSRACSVQSYRSTPNSPPSPTSSSNDSIAGGVAVVSWPVRVVVVHAVSRKHLTDVLMEDECSVRDFRDQVDLDDIGHYRLVRAFDHWPIPHGYEPVRWIIGILTLRSACFACRHGRGNFVTKGDNIETIL